MLVLHDHAPVWLGRQMDAGSISLTTHLGPESVRPYAEDLVQCDRVHPMDAIAGSLAELGLADKRIRARAGLMPTCW